MFFKRLGAILAAAALAGQPTAVLAQETCLTKPEVKMGLSYIAPMLIDGVMRACTPYLPAGSALLTLGPQIANDYRAIANTSNEDFTALLQKLARIKGRTQAETPPIERLKAEMLEAVTGKVGPEECMRADQLAVDLIAMPSTHVLGVIETLIYLAESSDRKSATRWSGTPIESSIFCG